MDRLWTEYTLEEGQPYFWQIGMRQLWIMHRGDEWLIAQDMLKEDTDENDVSFVCREKPEDLTWKRILCRTEHPFLRLMPQTPDRPVVVGSEYPVSIMPGNKGMFYVYFRSWISIQVGEHFKTTLLEIPTINLSNSWFGDPATGLASYSLKTSARRSISEERVPVYKIICPVLIANHSGEPLDFEKICVHVEHLKIYSSGEQLWANEVKILFQGEDKGSILKYSEKAPEQHVEGDTLTLMTPYRISPRPNLLKRSLSLIRNLTDIRGE